MSSYLIGIFIIGLIFLIFREIICWYWKINQQVALLTEIRDFLSDMSEKKNYIQQPNDIEADQIKEDTIQVATDPIKEKAAQTKLLKARKLEVKARKSQSGTLFDEVINLYKEIIDEFPQTNTAQNAQISFDNLRNKNLGGTSFP